LATLVAVSAFLVFGTTHAATLTLEFDTSFGDPSDPDTAPPDGATPWLTAVFDDGGTSGSVTLTMSVSADIGIAEITEVYFNLDPVLDPTLLSFSQASGPAPSTVNTGVDAFKPDSDGLMDILFDFQPPGGDSLGAGDVAVFNITSAEAILASSFNFFSVPDPFETDPTGPWRAAAKVASTGSDSVVCNSLNGPIGQCSDWIAPAIPIPGAVWLFGSAIGLLGWMRRRSV
jgi:hypothetical protein